MQKETVYIFFSEANTVEVKQLLEDFKKANINCIVDMPTSEKVQHVLQDNNSKALIIVSDNYLKSIDETRYLEELLNEEHHVNLIPVITNGRRFKDNNPNELEVYPTKIQTLNNVMYYRDFWYEEWIQLRKQCKTAPASEQEDLEEKKEIAKKMSVGSISTYIRKINNVVPVEWETFCANGYQVFFDKIGMGQTSLEERFSHQGQNGAVEELVSVVEEKVEEKVAAKEVEVVAMSNNSSDNYEKAVLEDVLKTEEVIDTAENNILEDVIENHHIELSELSNEVLEEVVETIPENNEVLEEVEILEEEEVVAETKEDTTVKTEEVVFVLADLNNLEHVDSDAILSEMNIEEVSNIDVLFHIAESETEEGDYEHARHAYERILKIDPYNGRALIWLSRILTKNFPEEALEAANTYRKAIMVNDENASLYYEYALLQKDQFQSYNKAMDSFREALDIDPMFEDAYFGLASCQIEMGMKDQAKANYLQACALDAARFQSAASDSQFGVVRVATVEAETAVAVVMEKEKNPNADTVVLVTGATSGIGKAIAELFIVNGFKVIATGRRNERLAALKYDMESLIEDAQVRCLPFDVCDLGAVEKAINNLPEEWANIDILINNAGLAKGFAPIQEGDITHWETMIDTNIKGLLYMSRMVTPKMVARQTGHIINIGSAAGTQVYSGGGVYCATKAAVDSLTQSMRLDLFKHNIKVSSVSPGHVEETEFAKVRYDGSDKANLFEEFKPLSSEDIANAVYYIATQPEHVNIQDMLMFGTQQGSTRDVNKSGRED